MLAQGAIEEICQLKASHHFDLSGRDLLEDLSEIKAKNKVLQGISTAPLYIFNHFNYY